jgi:hypothetical protein
MKITDCPAETRSAFAIWQMFRDFGFDSENLYVGIIDGRLVVQVKGSSEFSVALGRTRMSAEEFGRLWEDLAAAALSWSEETLRENYYAFVTPDRILMLLAALDAHDLRIPKDPRRGRMN